jgi:predicted dithiol-disulfide oxidoreductase (DUF899 family)
MLNKLLNRKKAPAKRKKKTTTTTIIDGNYSDKMKISIHFLFVDSTNDECKGCSILREQINTLTKRLERVERVVPVVKQFYPQKKASINFLNY